MPLVERAKNICLKPKSEWTVIAEETTASGTLIVGYVLPLAAMSAVAGLIGGSVVGHTLPFIGTYRIPIGTGLVLAIYRVVMAVVGVGVLALIINALAPSFGGEKNPQRALKVAAYSYTPAWLAGLFMLLPGLGVLALLGALFGLYVLYLGLPRLMKSPEDRSLVYTAVVVICAIVIGLVIGVVGGRIGRPAMMGGGGLAAIGTSRPTSEVQFDKDSPMGKLQSMSKKMEVAQKSGDAQEQLKIAMQGLGAVIGGGKTYDPLAIDQLKSFVPDSLAGLPKTRSKAEKKGIGGLMVSSAEATYGDASGKRVDLEISDTGGASGLVSLASWANLQSDKEDDTGVERMRKEGGRLVHEKISKGGGANEYGIALGDRFIVTARGQGVTIDELRRVVASLDLGQLESMKEVGAQQ